MAAIVDDGEFGDDDYNTLPDAGPTTQLGVGVEGKKLAEEQKKLFRVHKTILKMLRSRGYGVPDRHIGASLFAAFYASVMVRCLGSLREQRRRSVYEERA